MKKLLIIGLCSVALWACKDDAETDENSAATQNNPQNNQNQTENQNNASNTPSKGMPSDETIKAIAERLGQSEDEVRAQYQSCLDEGGKPIISGFGLPACVKPTADAGKSCAKKSDCESFCLAETMSCAPEKPIFGCFEIIDENGSTQTLCVD